MNLLTHNPDQQLSAKAKAFLARPKKLYINGQFVDAADGKTFETEDPALGSAITRVPSAGKEDVEQAAIAARQAFAREMRCSRFKIRPATPVTKIRAAVHGQVPITMSSLS